VSDRALAVFEPAPGGGQRLVLLPPTGPVRMVLWATIPIGIVLWGVGLAVSGRTVEGLLVLGVGAFTAAAAVRTFFRKDAWVLKPGAATRQRLMFGTSSVLEVTAIERVIAKKTSDTDDRKLLAIGLQHPGGWIQVGEDFDHDDRAEALAKGLAEALGVGLELPPRL
jgi:hypothetical protein